jgi:hypothetical protein
VTSPSITSIFSLMPDSSRESMADYFRAHGVIVLQLYQPESRFWLFQCLEAVLFASVGGRAARSYDLVDSPCQSGPMWIPPGWTGYCRPATAFAVSSTTSRPGV